MLRPFTTLIPLLAAGVLAGCTMTMPTTNPMTPPSPPLEGTSWVLAEIAGTALTGDGAATLAFQGGRAAGSDGCNRFTAGYRTSGSLLEIATSGAASTRMACPPDVMKQAETFMAALGAARSYRVDGDRLQLLASDGTVRATLRAVSQELAGTNWRATGINNGKGAVLSVLAGTSPTLQFGAGGQLSGMASCNRYTGRFEQSGSSVKIAPPAATRQSCGAAGVMEQESQFLQALESASTLRIEGNRLELRTATGALAVSAVRDPAP